MTRTQEQEKGYRNVKCNSTNRISSSKGIPERVFVRNIAAIRLA